MSTARYILLSIMLALILAATVLLAGFVPQDEGQELRRTVSHTIADLRTEDFPMPIESIGDQAHLWSIRRQAQTKTVVAEAPEVKSEEAKMTGHVQFIDQQVALLLNDDLVVVPELALVPLLSLDGISQPTLFGVQEAQFDVMDVNGDLMRWRETTSMQAGYTPFTLRRTYVEEKLPVVKKKAPAKANKPKVVLMAVAPKSLNSLPKALAPKNLYPAPKPLSRDYQVSGDSLARSEAYQGLIGTFAKRYDLDPTLLNAIIQSESNFNTGLVSPKKAVGLMQVLPSTASGEVHRYLYGKKGGISKAELHNPEVNIRYGTTYLHILKQNYFGGITNRLSREYCVVAAYNMGPNRVVKTFGPNPQAAAQVINSMSSEEVYQHLVSRLPKRETRMYVAKVRSLREKYAHMKP